MVGNEGPRMLKLTAQYADLWNTGYMGKPETMTEPLAKIESACHADRARPGDARHHSIHRPLVPRSPTKETELLPQSPNRHGAGDCSGNTWLPGARLRAAHHVSMRALHSRSAPATD